MAYVLSVLRDVLRSCTEAGSTSALHRLASVPQVPRRGSGGGRSRAGLVALPSTRAPRPRTHTPVSASHARRPLLDTGVLSSCLLFFLAAGTTVRTSFLGVVPNSFTSSSLIQINQASKESVSINPENYFPSVVSPTRIKKVTTADSA